MACVECPKGKGTACNCGKKLNLRSMRNRVGTPGGIFWMFSMNVETKGQISDGIEGLNIGPIPH